MRKAAIPGETQQTFIRVQFLQAYLKVKRVNLNESKCVECHSFHTPGKYFNIKHIYNNGKELNNRYVSQDI